MQKTPLAITYSVPSKPRTVKGVTEILAQVEPRKLTAAQFQEVLADVVGGDKGERVRHCGDWISLHYYHDEEQTAHIHRANWCRHPLCPMCSWRRHLTLSYAYSLAIEAARKDGNKLFFLTLTIPNTTGINAEKLRQLRSKAVTYIRKQLRCSSYICTLEVTYSQEKGYHPHIHAILCYPKQTPTPYVLEKIPSLRSTWGREWERTWLEATCSPIGTSESAAQEVSKYVAKVECSTVLLKPVLASLSKALYHLRRTSAAGSLKDYLCEARCRMAEEDKAEKERLAIFRPYECFLQWFKDRYIIFRQ